MAVALQSGVEMEQVSQIAEVGFPEKIASKGPRQRGPHYHGNTGQCNGLGWVSCLFAKEQSKPKGSLGSVDEGVRESMFLVVHLLERNLSVVSALVPLVLLCDIGK
jgi:hypothetical protein